MHTIYTRYFLLLFNIQMPVKIKRKMNLSYYLLSPLLVSLSHSFPNYRQLQGSLFFFAFDVIFPSKYYLTDISSSFEHVTPIFSSVLAILHNFNTLLQWLLCVSLAPNFLPPLLTPTFPLKSSLKSQSLSKLQNVWPLPISFLYL